MSELTRETTPDQVVEAAAEVCEALHLSLRDTFTPFSPIGTCLSPQELHAVFGGDHSALKDMYRLVLNAQTVQSSANISKSS